MRILLAGATGAVGRPLVRQLVEAGHEVVGLTRRPDRIAALEAAGARGVVCDARDLDALRKAAREARPELVMDQTTDLPQRYDTRDFDAFYQAMIPLRLLGSPNLLDLALEHDARHLFQSIAFACAPTTNGTLRSGDDPLWVDGAPSPWDLALPVIDALERRTVAHGGTVLRYGLFYGPGTHLDEGGQFHADVSRRRLPIVGDGGGVQSFIHVEDAASAAVAATERPAPGVFSVVDDRPLTSREWVRIYAEHLGARPPLRVPKLMARPPLAHRLALHFSLTMPGASNDAAKAALGWAPRYPTLADGLAA